MEFTHEIIAFKNSPVNLIVNRIENVHKHWHQSIELNFILDGNVAFIVGNKRYVLTADDAILINSNVIHELESDGATVITLQIKLNLITDLPEEPKVAQYKLNTADGTDPAKLTHIKQLIAKMLKINIEGGKLTELLSRAYCYQLIYELYAGFAVEGSDLQQSSERLDRLGQILNIINNGYMENLSLENIAGQVFVTIPYLSKFFKSNMDITITDYIKSIRLYHAMSDLDGTSLSIREIAEKNGFPNVRAFVSAFKEETGILPSDYRNNSKKDDRNSEDRKEKAVNYLDSESTLINNSTSRFINENLSPSDSATYIHNNTVSTDTKIISDEHSMPLKHNCRMFLGVSRASELLTSKIQAQLKEAQQKIHFGYIKMHGLLDDDMMAYGERRDGTPLYNFNRIDEVFDFLLSIGLRPLVQFSFMPSALAQNVNKKTFWAGSITSEPRNLEKWCGLIEALTAHLIDRYSKQEVEQWLFSVWNEPGSSNKMFGFKNDETFLKLYTSTYNTVKHVCPTLKFGGPSAFSTFGKNEDWLFRFLNSAKECNALPDFLDVHYYDIDLSEIANNKNDSWDILLLSPVENSFSLFLKRLKQRLYDDGFTNIPVYIIEWNSTVSHRDPLNDTCFKSSYIVKNIIDNYDEFDGLGYWLLSDYHNEFLQNPLTFHGGLGLFSVNSLKKPSFFAFEMLAKLGNRLIDKGDGYIITEQNGKYIMLLNNYSHYSAAYAKEPGVNTQYTDRNKVFPDKANISMSFCLPFIQKPCMITETKLNRHNGSVYDNFVKMSGLEPLSAEDIEYLKSVSIPKRTKHVHSPDNNGLLISASLEPHELRLIEIESL